MVVVLTTTVFTLQIWTCIVVLGKKCRESSVGGKYAVSLIYNRSEGSKILRKSTVYQELSYPNKNEYRSI